MRTGMSRRNFLQGVGVTAAGVGAAAMFTGCSSSESTDAEEVVTTSEDAVTEELTVPVMDGPDVTSYECDVLVVGGGWAGISAAREAVDNGMTVVMADKGRPGYSGLTPWSNSYNWFDADYDNVDQVKEMYRIGSEYACNQDWLDVWIAESKTAYEKCCEWGVMEQYEAASADYTDVANPKGYYNDVASSVNRHSFFRSAVVDYGIDLAEFTMVTDVIEEDGRIVGAVGFHVPSATVISFACKAVIMATGAGSYKPAGFPTGSSTFDGDYIAYNHGLSIAGKEYGDFHGTSNAEPGNVYGAWIGHWAQSNWLCTDDAMAPVWPTLMLNNVESATIGLMGYDPSGTSDMGGPPADAEEEVSEGEMPEEEVVEEEVVVEEPSDDVRLGELGSLFSTMVVGQMGCGNAAPGMGIHKGEGVFISNEATTATALPGLFYAGDALSSSSIGVAYFGVGFSSCMSCVQGRLAAQEASEYAAGAEAGFVTAETLETQTAAILAPMENRMGFDPIWLRDVLLSIMTPGNVTTAKSEPQLLAALTFVEWMRDVEAPIMCAVDGHELRLCHEMKSKILNAEMKLRASLERKESRGRHYRTDYPYRDDDNFLCHITLTKGSDGSMETGKVSFNEEWVGDTSMAYEDRYLVRFPGEMDALGIADPGLSTEEIVAIVDSRIMEA